MPVVTPAATPAATPRLKRLRDLDPDERASARRLAKEIGQLAAARQLGIAPQAAHQLFNPQMYWEQYKRQRATNRSRKALGLETL